MKSIRIALWMLALLLAGCKPSTKSIATIPAKKAVQAPCYNEEQLAYNLKTTVEAYETAGRKNAKWDDLARKCLTAFARTRSVTNHAFESMERDLAEYLPALADLKCDDPMIRYLHVRFVYSNSNSCDRCAAEYGKIAADMDQSSYPDIRKHYAHMWHRRTLLSGLQEGGKQVTGETPEIAAISEKAARSLAKAIDDPAMPLIEVDQACDGLMSDNYCTKEPNWTAYRHLAPALTNRWNGTSPMLLTKGRAYVAHAWMARGNGLADTVSEKNWRLMEERLAIASEAYEAAWLLNTNDVRICFDMLGLELLQNQGRERLELWFDRGMKIDPGNYSLCSSKLHYLRPRWYGSYEEMIAFGRACTDNPKYEGAVRLMLADAHYTACLEIPDKKQRETYLRQKRVWADIEHTFEQFFRLYPNEVGYRHNYARYAAMCGRWKIMSQQFKLFPSTNYAYFGGIEAFHELERMIQ